MGLSIGVVEVRRGLRARSLLCYHGMVEIDETDLIEKKINEYR